MMLDRSCTADSDCGFVEEVKCCGLHAVVGVRATEATRACPMSCGELGCPAESYRADDGTPTRRREEILARCVAGTCTTRINSKPTPAVRAGAR